MPKTPEFECAMHFFTLMASKPVYEELVSNWIALSGNLLTELSCSPEELQELMTWAVTENTDPKPQFDSTQYIASAKNPMATFAKHASMLHRIWKSRNKKVVAKVIPLPYELTHWLMTGPGVNAPLNGFTNWREKLDSIKRSWYRTGWERQPDPEGITEKQYEEWFEYYLRELSRR
jgi:hypothetical protein